VLCGVIPKTHAFSSGSRDLIFRPGHCWEIPIRLASSPCSLAAQGRLSLRLNGGCARDDATEIAVHKIKLSTFFPLGSASNRKFSYLLEVA